MKSQSTLKSCEVKQYDSEMLLDADFLQRVTTLLKASDASIKQNREKLALLFKRLDESTSKYYEQKKYQALLHNKMNLFFGEADIVKKIETNLTERSAELQLQQDALSLLQQQIKSASESIITKTYAEHVTPCAERLLAMKKDIITQLQKAGCDEWDRIPIADREKKRADFIKRYGDILSFTLSEKDPHVTELTKKHNSNHAWYEQKSLEAIIELANQIQKRCETHRRASLYDTLFGENPIDPVLDTLAKSYHQYFSYNKTTHQLFSTPQQVHEHANQLLLATTELAKHREQAFKELNARKHQQLDDYEKAIPALIAKLKKDVSDPIDSMLTTRLQDATRELEESVSKKLDYITAKYLEVQRVHPEIDRNIQAVEGLIDAIQVRKVTLESSMNQMDFWTSQGEVQKAEECKRKIEETLGQLEAEKKTIKDALDLAQRNIHDLLVSKTKEAIARATAIHEKYGDSDALQTTQTQIAQMQRYVKAMEQQLTKLNEQMDEIEKVQQNTKRFQRTISEKLATANRVLEERQVKQASAADMYKTIRMVLATKDNLLFWSNKVRGFGGTTYDKVNFPTGISYLLKVLAANPNPSDPQAVLMHFRTTALRMLEKTQEGCKNFIKYNIFHVRRYEVMQLYALLSSLKDDPRENDMNMFNRISGLKSLPPIQTQIQLMPYKRT